MAGEKKVFYWDGVDHEDLFCVCGTPHPVQIFDDAFPDKWIRQCSQCGAVAEFNDGSDEWEVR